VLSIPWPAGHRIDYVQRRTMSRRAVLWFFYRCEWVAMDLLRQGVEQSVNALWLGHESI
jgi:hypothetical protein